jgi:malate permease and related proteins
MSGTLTAVLQMALIAALGFVLFRRNILEGKSLDFLTTFTVNYTVPLMIFVYLVQSANVVVRRPVWIFVGLSLAIFALGWVLGYLLTLRSGSFKKEIIGLLSLQNAGYLPMNLAVFMLWGRMRDEFLVYVILYLLGFNILMWSLSGLLIYHDTARRFDWKQLFNPSLIATIIGLLVVYTKLSRYFGPVILGPLKMVGDTTFVLSMIVLGAWLAKVKLAGISKTLAPILRVSAVKLVLMPMVVFGFLFGFKIFSFMGFFVLMQAAMPSAATLPIVSDMHRADSEFTSQGVFLTHVLSVISVPFWLESYIRVSARFFVQ